MRDLEGPGEGDRASLRAERDESLGIDPDVKVGLGGSANVGRGGNVDTIGKEGWDMDNLSRLATDLTSFARR